MADRDRDDQARAGDDLRLHALLRRFTVTVEHRQPTEGGIDGEIETADGIEQPAVARRPLRRRVWRPRYRGDGCRQASDASTVVLAKRKDGLTMPYQDLRAFLTALKNAGELVDIARPIALKYDIAKALAKTSSVQGPALMFTQTGTDFPLVAGVSRQPPAGADGVRGDRADDPRQGAQGDQQPDRPRGFQGSAALPGDRADGRRDRRHQAAGADLQPQGRRPLHHRRASWCRRIPRPAPPISATTASRSTDRRSWACSPRRTIASARTSRTPRRWESSCTGRS